MNRKTFKRPVFRLLRQRLEDEDTPGPSVLFRYFRSTFLFVYLVFAIDCLLPVSELTCGTNIVIETTTSYSKNRGSTTSRGPVLYACDRRISISYEASHHLNTPSTIIGVSPIFQIYKYARSGSGIAFILFNFISALALLSLTAVMLVISFKNDMVRMFIGALGPVLVGLSLWLIYF